MKAIVMTAPGGPEVLKLMELPEPTHARATDVLVRLKAAGINPVDAKMRANPAAYPAALSPVLGFDGAGIVETVGAEVPGFKPGDAVYFCQCGLGERNGAYAQVAAVDYRLVAHKPASLSFEEAAAAPLVLITAWESLYDRVRLDTARTILIHAGAGGVGHVAIQLARINGVEVGTTVSSTDKAAFAAELGANRVILYKEENFAAATLDWTQQRGVDIALDTVGGKTLADTFAAVRYYGDVVTLLQPGSEVDWSIPRLRNQRLSFEIMLTPLFYGLTDALAHQGKILKRCAELIDHGRLRVHVGATLPLAQAGEAHALLASGQIKGKIVLTME